MSKLGKNQQKYLCLQQGSKISVRQKDKRIQFLNVQITFWSDIWMEQVYDISVSRR